MIIELSEVRAEGLTEAVADDDRVEMAIDQAQFYIESVSGVPFREVEFTLNNPLLLDGPGTPTLHLMMPILSVSEAGTVSYNGTKSAFLADTFMIYNRRGPGQDDRLNPKIVRRNGNVWPEGNLNIYLVGKFGWTELAADPSDPETMIERAPARVRRAALLLVINDFIPLLTDAEAQDDRLRRWIKSETTEGHRYELSDLALSGGTSGIREVDQILRMYRRPRAVIA